MFQICGKVVSAPAIGANSIVYLGSDDSNFYAIDGSSGGLADVPWHTTTPCAVQLIRQ